MPSDKPMIELAREHFKGLDYPTAEEIAAFATQQVASAVEAEREECCKDMCPYCTDAEQGEGYYPAVKSHLLGWWHSFKEAAGGMPCKAATIRARKESR